MPSGTTPSAYTESCITGNGGMQHWGKAINAVLQFHLYQTRTQNEGAHGSHRAQETEEILCLAEIDKAIRI